MIRPGIRRLFRLAVRRWRGIPGRVSGDVDAEIHTHLQLRIEALVREGWSAESAAQEALRRFGSLDDARRTLRESGVTRERRMHIGEWLSDVWSDVRYAARAMRREPAFAAFAVITLALGIGVNSSMFGVVDRLLLSGPAHVRDAGSVRRLQLARTPPGRDEIRGGRFGYVAYDALRRSGKTFDAIAAYSVASRGAILGRGAEARWVNQGEATASLFSLLGVQPAVGRFFDETEDDVVAPQRVAVLSHALWQSEYGGRSGAVGQSIMINNNAHTIVGVAPRGFTGPDLGRVDVWLPESLVGRDRSSPWNLNWNSWWLSIVVRLAPGVTAEQADAEATSIIRSAYDGRDQSMRQATLSTQPLRFLPDGRESVEARVSKWLLAVSVCVLLIACANVVNLQLARALQRQRELGVRITLGAGRARLVRLFVTEALVLSAAGGAASVAVAAALNQVMRSRLIPNVEWTSSLVDSRVILASAIVSLVVGLVVGLVPAYRASAPDLASAMKAGVREGGGRTGRVRAVLTVAQAALSVVLLVGAGLFVQSLRRVRALDLGSQPDRVVAFMMSRTSLGTFTDTADRRRERERREVVLATIVEEIRRRPDVERASVAIGLPFATGFGVDIRVPGRDSVPVLSGGGPYAAAVGADYFATVGTRIVQGRPFTSNDRKGSAPVAIVNETMARTLWPGEDAIGKCFFMGGSSDCAVIVGVAANVNQSRLLEPETMSYYVPFGQQVSIGGTHLVVRPHGDAKRVMPEIQRQLVALDPTIVVVRGDYLQDLLDPQIRPWRLGATMFSLMGVLALIVAAAGLYSVTSYLVANRTHEIGVRFALGARTGDVVRLVVRGGVVLAVGGVAIGLVLAAFCARAIEPLLFDTSPRDPAVLGAVALVLLAAAVVASVVPALRAGKVSPMEAMRME